MNNDSDFRGWLATAHVHLSRAELNAQHKDNPISYPAIVHYAQLALECAAKVIISYYHEPRWTHDPSEELLTVIRTQGKKLEKRLSKTTMRELRQLALDARTYAKWHIWATYGSHEVGGAYHSPDELCTLDVVADLMPLATHPIP